MPNTIYQTLELLGPRVLVRPLRELDLTAGGIVRPDMAKLPQNRAIVEKVGPGGTNEAGVWRALPFNVGDVVFYQKFAGAFVYLADFERLMLMEDEIQARIPAAACVIVEHGDDGVNDHLEGEPCLTCMKPAEEAAKRNLAAMREALVHGSSPDATGCSTVDGSASA